MANAQQKIEVKQTAGHNQLGEFAPEFAHLNNDILIFPVGKLNEAYAKYFVGQSYLAPLNMPGVFIANVTFEPGCRNNWHGASPNSWFSHLAFELPGKDLSNEWLEPVTEEDYNKLK